MTSCTKIATLLLALLTSSTFAQLLTQGNGQLPACGQSCTVLTTSQNGCPSSNSLDAWACFCKAVWTNSGQSPATMCAAQCPDPEDNADISTWYTQNCGSDNGASEHGGGSDGSPAASGDAAQASSTSAGAQASDDEGGECVGSWWACHWQWVVMIIVIAIGLIVLGFGGRWLKRRHDRKKDRTGEGFNTGITTRKPNNGPMTDDKFNESYVGTSAGMEAGNGRDSPARTRDAFMPYGYGYNRSESRLGTNENVKDGARGATPPNDVEKAGGATDSRNQSRRVLVREESMGENTR